MAVAITCRTAPRTPAMMIAIAWGTSTWVTTCHSVSPMARAASTVVRSVEAMPE